MTGDRSEPDELVIPPGFQRMPEGLGFGDRIQPFYRRRNGRDVSFGFFVAPQHLNLMGICHGGCLMTLADIAAASSIHAQRDEPGPSPTINMSFDFQSPGREGRWLETSAQQVEVKRRFGFCSGLISDGDKVVLRYSGTFYFPDSPELTSATTGSNAIQLLIGDDAPAD